MLDLACLVAPIGIFFVRIANFIKPELWGRPTDVPWAIIFPGSDGLPRHPSQIYEALLEGLAAFVILCDRGALRRLAPARLRSPAPSASSTALRASSANSIAIPILASKTSAAA